MTQKARLIILLVCVVCFLAIAPVLIGYSMGYRFDFEKIKITATGGIYVKAYPSPDQVVIDSKITQKPGVFSSSVFVQSLLPKLHAVLVQKADYYDYFKTIPVQEKEVAKLENIILFKKNINFQIVDGAAASTQGFGEPKEKYIIKNNDLYYSDIPENVGISQTQKATPVLKKVSAFALQNGNIIWLGTDGFLYKSNTSNLSAEPTKLILTPIKLVKTGVYKIITNNNNIFVNNNQSLLFLNTKTNELNDFYSPVAGAEISPDGKNLLYYNENSIYISPLPIATDNKNTILYKSTEKINNCLWLGNYYVVFSTGDPEKNGASKIIISETDTRGNINTITLPQNLTKPEIYFDQQEGRLYISSGKTLLVSEKIVP